jgi:hypothetical protein
VADFEAIEAFKLLTELEGIIPALESSHAVAYAIKMAKKYKKNDIIVVCLSGRGDKDIDSVLRYKVELDEDKIEEVTTSENKSKFRYTTKQAKFSQDNKIKQKALALGEDLINFLNDNNIKNCFVEPLVGFINNEVVVINMPLTDEDLFIDELLYKINTSTIKLDQETIDKCAVLISKYSADCSAEI